MALILFMLQVRIQDNEWLVSDWSRAQRRSFPAGKINTTPSAAGKCEDIKNEKQEMEKPLPGYWNEAGQYTLILHEIH